MQFLRTTRRTCSTDKRFSSYLQATAACKKMGKASCDGLFQESCSEDSCWYTCRPGTIRHTTSYDCVWKVYEDPNGGYGGGWCRASDLSMHVHDHEWMNWRLRNVPNKPNKNVFSLKRNLAITTLPYANTCCAHFARLMTRIPIPVCIVR